MRPIRHRQSELWTPLNRILGREAAVRLLRVLALRREPSSRAELARQAALDPAGARRALVVLAESGILDESGSGRAQQIRLRSRHPLSRAIRTLFADEHKLASAVVGSIRRAVQNLRPPPRAAWIAEPEPSGSVQSHRTATVGVLTSSRYATQMRDVMTPALAKAEKDTGTPLDFQIWTEPDLAALSQQEREMATRGLSLLGPPPAAWLRSLDNNSKAAPSGSGARTHADLDDQARRLGQAVATKLARDPHLVRLTRQALSRQLLSAAPGERATLREWQRLLRTLPLAQLRKFLVDPGPRATRLRQSLPFTDILTPKERAAALVNPIARQR